MRIKNSTENVNKVPPLKELEARPNCPLCGGRGTLAYIPHHLDATKFREIRACGCVRKIINWKDG
jgi:hypothetical protein